MRITLCGSAKFEEEYIKWNEILTLQGHVIYSLAVLPSHKETIVWYSVEEKEMLDLVHLVKIMESDAIVVINCADAEWEKEAYVGESTRQQIIWAKMHGKPCFYTRAIRGDVRQMFNKLEAYAWRGIMSDENI